MTRGRRGGGRSGAARAKPPSLGALRRRLEAFCRSLPGVTADVKWGHELVFSVGGKMFAGFDAAGGDGVGFKTEPMLFAALIKKRGIRPAPYAARFHW